jgi:hypothetical protein
MIPIEISRNGGSGDKREQGSKSKYDVFDTL